MKTEMESDQYILHKNVDIKFTADEYAQRQMIGRPNKSLGSRNVKVLERIDKIGYDH